MANENFEPRRKVTRQSWKLTGLPAFLHGLWMVIFSIIKVVLGAVATVVVIGGVCVLVFVGTLGDYLQEDIIPNSGVSLEGFDLKQNSMVYYVNSSGNIETLQKLYAESTSTKAVFEEIPQAMIDAAVAIEDKRFYEHQGVDWFTTIKACVNMFLGSGDQFGGSSITQQLIKNLFLMEDESADDVTVQRKVQEIFRATELEKRYDKKVIITWYLNEIYLGNRVYGVKAAAEYYFGKELELLTPAECACLISITNNPSIFDPTSTKVFDFEVTEGDVREMDGYQRNKVRKENTLWVMRNEGYLTEEEYQEALAQELVFKRGIDEGDRLADCSIESCGYHGQVKTFQDKGNGKYVCPACGNTVELKDDASQEVYSWFVDTLLEDVAMAFGERDGLDWSVMDKKTKNSYLQLYKDMICNAGYHIYSTLDMDVQTSVDRIYTNLDEIPKTESLQQLQSGMVIIDNKTGDIVAMAGGVGEKKVHDAYNRATDAALQPGSSLKPLTVYAPGFELGAITPNSVVEDLPLYYTAERPYPYNDTRTYSYNRTIFSAVELSINAVAVNVLDTIGFKYSYNFAKERFGLSWLVDEYKNSSGQILTDLGYSPLGMGAPTVGVSVRQMAEAYATFANNGVRREARTFTKVYNSNGDLILDNTQDSYEILSEKTVDYMNYCLDNAVAAGTGASGDMKNHDVAGKTGTTSSQKDRWFCGYTGYYTAAVWCGYDIPEVMNLVDYSVNPACNLFVKVLEPVHEGLPRIPLYREDDMRTVDICVDCGNLATTACNMDARIFNTGLKRTEAICLYVEDIPVESCKCHVMVDFCETCNAVANEYCKQFDAVGICTVSKRSLYKLTADGVDDLAAAIEHGLREVHTRDNFIYLVDKYGNAVNNYHGLLGDKNKGINAPYLVCDLHTKEQWEAYITTGAIPEIDLPEEEEEINSTE